MKICYRMDWSLCDLDTPFGISLDLLLEARYDGIIWIRQAKDFHESNLGAQDPGLR